MASHITCHRSDILPNSFPPPRPTEREYRNFMASEYQASSIMDKSNPREKYLESKDSYFQQDDFPVLSKPAPTVTSLYQNTGFNLDPQLLVTPEKAVSPDLRKSRYLPDPDLTLTPEKGSPFGRNAYADLDDSITQLKQFAGSQRTVRFDQNVEVLQMSPQSSTLGTSPNQLETNPSIFNPPSLRQNVAVHSQHEQYLNSDEKLDSATVNCEKDQHAEILEKSRKTVVKNDPKNQNPRSVDVVFTARNHRTNTTSSRAGYTGAVSGFSGSQSASSGGESSGLDSFSSHSSTEPESMETIDIIASDLQPRHQGSRTKKSSRGGKVFSEGIVENTFARPEFSSTLRVRKEMNDLKDTEVDLVKAVKQKLKTSGKTKSKLSEKAYSHVNRGDELVYQRLPGIEVQTEDAVSCAEDQITARVKPIPKTLYKAEAQLQQAPDIMTFFERKFQRETASLTLTGLPDMKILQPQTAELNRAFDVYTHVRGWENW